jgi:hypothetical protein
VRLPSCCITPPGLGTDAFPHGVDVTEPVLGWSITVSWCDAAVVVLTVRSEKQGTEVWQGEILCVMAE